MEVGSEKLTSVVHGNFLSSSPFMKHCSPRQRGALYDSFELLAMTRQLNKAIQGSGTTASSSPPFKFIPNSSFYKLQVNQICKENGGSRRRVSTYQLLPGAMPEKRHGINEGGAPGFVARLWKKVKQGLSRK